VLGLPVTSSQVGHLVVYAGLSEVILFQLKSGISSAANALNVGAALLPLAGPASTRFFALVPYGFLVSPYASLSEIVVLALEPLYVVEVLDYTGEVAPIVTDVIPELVT